MLGNGKADEQDDKKSYSQANRPKYDREDAVYARHPQIRQELGDAAERDSIRRLNLRAGRMSRTSAAYGAAREYLTQAGALMPADSWSTDYVEAFATFLELAECEYLVGRFERADSMFREILQRARDDLDRAKAILGGLTVVLDDMRCRVMAKHGSGAPGPWDDEHPDNGRGGPQG